MHLATTPEGARPISKHLHDTSKARRGMQHITIGTAGPNTLYVDRKSANGRPLDVGRHRHSELDCNQAIAISVPDLIQEKACDPPGQRTGDPPVEPGSLVLVAGLLNAALR